MILEPLHLRFRTTIEDLGRRYLNALKHAKDDDFYGFFSFHKKRFFQIETKSDFLDF